MHNWFHQRHASPAPADLQLLRHLYANSKSQAPKVPSLSPGECQDPALWAATHLDFQPDPVQAEILSSPAHRLILCCTRQYGKSTITAIKAIHQALANPGSLILIAARAARQSNEWLETASGILLRLGIAPCGDGRHRHSIRLPNRSRLIALPGRAPSLRGFAAVSLLIFDEAAFVPDALYHALNPMLAVSDGSLWIISTPNGQSGFFYEEWHRQPSLFTRFQVKAEDCPRISKSFLAHQRITLGDPTYRREYQCEFTPEGQQVLTRDLVDAAFDDDLSAFNKGNPLWKP